MKWPYASRDAASVLLQHGPCQATASLDAGHKSENADCRRREGRNYRVEASDSAICGLRCGPPGPCRAAAPPWVLDDRPAAVPALVAEPAAGRRARARSDAPRGAVALALARPRVAAPDRGPDAGPPALSGCRGAP